MLAPIPIISEDQTGTYPHPGVIATKPHTDPDAKPNIEGFLAKIYCQNIHVRPDRDADKLVDIQATAEMPVAPNAEPPLKPNQPNHNNAVPSKVNDILHGIIDVYLYLLPNTIAAANPANPLDTCTTFPPAKSRAPHLKHQPSIFHIQCAIGQYTTIIHMLINSSNDINFIRSTTEPIINAGVIPANFS